MEAEDTENTGDPEEETGQAGQVEPEVPTEQNQYQETQQQENVQEGIPVLINDKVITLSPLLFEDFTLTYIIERGDMRNPTEQQAVTMVKLINKLLSRSRLTPEEIGLLKGNSEQELLRNYHIIAAAIERTLLVTLTS
ncbi:MAG: hypothetical protein SCH70_07795 [Candidatus Methanoperedens sp.]|nr:hypothetical protein [Candidatus Methanoperedens sp.]